MLGGQVNVFLSGLPTIGPGALKPRDDPTTYNTDKERALFSPADPFWRKVSDELAECGVGVNTFLFPDQYTDVASIGVLGAVTGGRTFFHPKFHPVRDRDTVFSEINQITNTSANNNGANETVYNATTRIRCSNGLRIADHVGNFYQRSLTDLEFGLMDSTSAFMAIIKHDSSGKLDERVQGFVQVAVLHTTSAGERRVRIMNMSFGVTSLIGNVFRFADLDASVTVFIKDGGFGFFLSFL